MIEFNEELIEKLASKVHDSWWEEKEKQGFHPPNKCKNTTVEYVHRQTHCDKCNADMYPYAELPEHIKNCVRVMVKTVFNAIFGIHPE